MNSESQAALGCTCGNPKATGVWHRTNTPCQLTYATVPVAPKVPTCPRLTGGTCGCTAYCGEYWDHTSASSKASDA